MVKSVEEMLNGLAAWEESVKNDGYVDSENRIVINEAFASPDAPILFPKVINRTLREAAEPTLLVTPLLDVVRLGQGRSLEFPAVNAIQADLGEQHGGEHCAQQAQAERKEAGAGAPRVG